MRFGKKAGTITSGGGNATGDWPKGLREGETRVRFVTEIADWQEYWEHYDETVKFFPCTGDKQTCPGCTSDIERTARASKRYLAPVLDPKTGRVYGLKMGVDLANRLSLRNDRNNGTITNRDYTLIRSGKGLDTEYDVEQEEKVAIDLSHYSDAIDLEEMLASQFAAAWPDFQEPGSKPAKAAPARSREVAPPPPPRRSRAAAANGAADPVPQPVGDTDPPPSEGSAPQDAAPEPSDDTVELTEDELRTMSRQDLIKLARQAEVPVTLTMSREEIVDLFLSQFSV